MNNIDDFELDENVKLEVRPRESEAIALQIPKDAIESLKRIAAQREMSLEALLRFYIGKCLRQDLSQQFANQVFDSAAKVLARYHHSEDEVAKILQEIRLEAK